MRLRCCIAEPCSVVSCAVTTPAQRGYARPNTICSGGGTDEYFISAYEVAGL
ncbi:hypothetical protein [Stenotrophomonas sp. Iso1]|uniref:hypothetical protein n=1 Tax=Stenotrophomonas sp. Iso1 TaxID=2977283 RepID=UPI0022B79078|nr:hypothetical protein [Stenotrophomonas sp. Iso1]